MKLAATNIERARAYVARMPVAISGQGGHAATYHVAAVLVHGFALAEAEALNVLRDWNHHCQPPWSEANLIHKIRSAAAAKHHQPRGWLLGPRTIDPRSASQPAQITVPPKPAFDPERLKQIAAKIAGIADVVPFIAERSPVVVETQDSASVLRRLYRRGSGEKVLVFTDLRSQGQMLWEADQSDLIFNRHLPVGEAGVWFLPQPVGGTFHPNPRLGGKLSRRSEEAVMAWRYAVLESDQAQTDDWLRCLVQMPLPIACVCESGGRSIHALVRLDAASKLAWDRSVGSIKPLLVTLGADAGALSAVRLSRLPQARRGDRVQRLLFLNPEPDAVPIVNRPTRESTFKRWPCDNREGLI